VRSAGSPDEALQSVKKQLCQINADLVRRAGSPSGVVVETQGWGQGRFIATLFSLFAILALALACNRTLQRGLVCGDATHAGSWFTDGSGRARSNILQLVIRSTAIMLAAGIVVGLGLTIALNRVVGAWAGGSPRDPLILSSAALVLVLVSVIACVAPAWRAASVDPAVALSTSKEEIT